MQKSRTTRQRYFIERDLFFQTLTLLLTVLLGGFLLLLLSKTISGYVDSSLLFLMLFIGYFLLIIFFAWSLSRKFIGPFSRLKENMKDIARGDLSLRLQVRSGDDVRIKTFVEEANRLVRTFNNCLEKVKSSTGEMAETADELLARLEGQGSLAGERDLEALRGLRAQIEAVHEAAARLKSGHRPWARD